jgi:signal transduction histidine kinase
MSGNGPNGEADRYLRTAFLERVAHELRGPAGVIQGALQELELALGPEAQTHQRLFDMARRGVQRIVRSADRLQQIGVCERGKLPIVPAPCDVGALVRKSVADAEALEGRRKIAVTLDLPSDPLLSSLDPRWVSIALYEVASNAIRYARERVQVKLSSLDGELQVLFRDDNAVRSSFGPMRFVPPSEARGLGLALAIVRDVIEAHGGHLEIAAAPSSTESPGTEVRLYLPHADGAIAKTGASGSG